jgi:hypothetical protein
VSEHLGKGCPQTVKWEAGKVMARKDEAEKTRRQDARQIPYTRK